MNLSSLQDVAGVRIITNSLDDLEKVEEKLLSLPNLKRKPKDYIQNPKPSGYRGRHFVYEKDGMLVEIQLRTYIQHLWATAVETIGVFENIPLKTVGGPKYWEEFFRLTSAIFSIIEETPILEPYNTEDIIDLAEKLNRLMQKHKINSKFKNYAATNILLDGKKEKDPFYILISLNNSTDESILKYYREIDYEVAVADYEALEKQNQTENVLISLSKLKELQEAYPAYFLDITKFNKIIQTCLKTAGVL